MSRSGSCKSPALHQPSILAALFSPAEVVSCMHDHAGLPEAIWRNSSQDRYHHPDPSLFLCKSRLSLLQGSNHQKTQTQRLAGMSILPTSSRKLLCELNKLPVKACKCGCTYAGVFLPARQLCKQRHALRSSRDLPGTAEAHLLQCHLHQTAAEASSVC